MAAITSDCCLAGSPGPTSSSRASSSAPSCSCECATASYNIHVVPSFQPSCLREVRWQSGPGECATPLLPFAACACYAGWLFFSTFRSLTKRLAADERRACHPKRFLIIRRFMREQPTTSYESVNFAPPFRFLPTYGRSWVSQVHILLPVLPPRLHGGGHIAAGRLAPLRRRVRREGGKIHVRHHGAAQNMDHPPAP